MRTITGLALLTMTALVAGCGSSIHDPLTPGPVDDGLYQDALLDNAQRVAGEDTRVESLYKTPVKAVELGYDTAVGQPITNMWRWIWHDTPAEAARDMVDPDSADRRFAGTLRMTDFPFARRGASIKVYAHQANDKEDYIVRAAGLRALNRCRASGYTDLFLHNLSDDHPLVRLEAAGALSNIPDPTAMSALIDHLQRDVSIDVRIACAEALRNFKNGEATTALVDVLGDKNFGVAWQARQSLELMTGQDYRYDTRAWLGYFSTVRISG